MKLYRKFNNIEIENLTSILNFSTTHSKSNVKTSSYIPKIKYHIGPKLWTYNNMLKSEQFYWPKS